MTDKPLCTVVVPVLNQGAFLERTLASIVAQDVPIELFVMDGGSTDGTLDVIERWRPHLTAWRSGPDGGQSAAINAGMRLGSAPYVAWLNADDTYCRGALRSLGDLLERSPDCPVAY